ncbi:hypothetical protein [Phycicoccus avicenniae]|uniref:hypothetical protein n=1 Tax=Phycicoccus avicenniae TaxID=2828860 RepID=UPI003D2BC49C
MPQKFTNGIDLAGKRAQNAADGTQPTDLTTLQQVRALINARSPKDDVVVASSSNINLSAPGATVDGVTMSTGMRFIARGQTTGSQNGIYDWNGAAVAATRSADADSITELSGAVVAVQRGTDADKLFLITNDDTDTLGTTTITFLQTGVGASYIAGAGMTLSGSTFDVGAGTGIVVGADTVSVDTSVVARRMGFDCVATTNPQTFTHGLGTDVQVEVWEGTTKVFPDVTKAGTSGGQVTVDWGGAPTAAQYRVVVVG